MKIKLPGLVCDKDRHGNTRYYVRVKGRPKVRIRAEVGSPEFRAAYEAASASSEERSVHLPGGAVGTLAWLGRLYMKSAEFKKLPLGSRRTRMNVLEYCFAEPLKPGSHETFGNCPVNRFEAEHAQVLRDRKDFAGKPGAANNRLKWLSAMFAWAVEKKKATRNPLRDVRKVRYETDGFHTWTVDEVHQFMTVHPLGSIAHLAMKLMLLTGARRQDAYLLGPQHIKGGWLKFKPRKTASTTRQELDLPVLPLLQAAIAATPCGDFAFILSAGGRAFASADSFGNWFRDRCKHAGLPHCTPHGLRKAGATIAAENGATERELMAIFGWATSKEATVYTRKANQRKLAGRAMAKLWAG